MTREDEIKKDSFPSLHNTELAHLQARNHISPLDLPIVRVKLKEATPVAGPRHQKKGNRNDWRVLDEPRWERGQQRNINVKKYVPLSFQLLPKHNYK